MTPTSYIALGILIAAALIGFVVWRTSGDKEAPTPSGGTDKPSSDPADDTKLR